MVAYNEFVKLSEQWNMEASHVEKLLSPKLATPRHVGKIAFSRNGPSGHGAPKTVRVALVSVRSL